MTERPILFSAPMIRALLAGTKTQTRRLVTVPWQGGRRALPFEPYWVEEDGRLLFSDESGEYRPWIDCAHPYGVVGDKLWVRETWQTSGNHESALAATGRDSHEGPCFTFAADRVKPGRGWRPSIFMPRGASRITLEITSVRVQRLQRITEEDAKAEGVTPDADCIANRCARPHWDGYMDLWDSINGKRAPWKTNPWVWVIGFEVMK